jgi:hypothetical protein
MPPADSPAMAREIDRLCDRYGAALARGETAALGDWLPADEPFRGAALVELVRVELEYRLRTGDAVRAEEYLDRYPELAADPAKALKIVLAEFRARSRDDSATDPREYVERFPQFAGHPAWPTLVSATTPPQAPAPGASLAGTTVPPVTPVEGGPLPPHIPGYQMDRLLGEGGMGVVWLGRDLRLKRDVAVKVMHDKWCGHPQFGRRFTEEAQVASQLQHPAIPPVHELGELPDGRPYFAMKLVKGRTLADLLGERSGSAYNLPRFLHVFEQMCQAVAYAHSKGVIHRDLKPLNVMVGAFGEVQVMDWGLAKVLDREPPQGEAAGSPGSVVETVRTRDADHATHAGAVLGTYAYMPPEQARGEVESLDRRCDVFGLGAILCEILTGKPPYVGTNEEKKIQAQLGHVAPALARLEGCGADEELVELACRCLSARAEGRPPDAGAVAEAVARYLAGVQERLRAAELERATAAAKAREEEAKATAAAERRVRRLALGLVVALVVGIATTAYLLFLARGQAGKAALRAEEAFVARQSADEERRKAEEQKRRAEDEKRDADEARGLAEGYRRRAEWHLYGDKIVRAQRAWQDGDMVQAQDLLNACQPDLRGWEHRYVSTLVNGTQRAFLGHTGPVHGVCFSPDGKRLASASVDGVVKVWDAATGQEALTLRGSTGPIWGVCYSPDGRRLASAGEGGTVKVWDAATGEEALTLKGHTRIVNSVCFSPDGKWLASASMDGTVKVWGQERK